MIAEEMVRVVDKVSIVELILVGPQIIKTLSNGMDIIKQVK